jgi:hypothetical protein
MSAMGPALPWTYAARVQWTKLAAMPRPVRYVLGAAAMTAMLYGWLAAGSAFTLLVRGPQDRVCGYECRFDAVGTLDG